MLRNQMATIFNLIHGTNKTKCKHKYKIILQAYKCLEKGQTDKIKTLIAIKVLIL